MKKLTGSFLQPCKEWATELVIQLFFAMSCFFCIDICYNIALCYYRLKHYAGALKFITEIIERGIKDHPGEQTIYITLYFLNGKYRIECWFTNRRT